MYFHLYRNTFISTLADKSQYLRSNDYRICGDEPITDTNDITFYVVAEKRFNELLLSFCRTAGLTYEEYCIIIKKSLLNFYLILHPYDTSLHETYRMLTKEQFLQADDAGPISLTQDNAPAELLMDAEVYLKTYRRLAEQDKSFINPEHSFDEVRDTEFFLTSPRNNLSYESEFQWFYLNKRLMLHLKERRYAPCLS